jgi:UDP-glucose 4-epimerase
LSISLPERVFVTGANGFVGGHLLPALQGHGIALAPAVRRELTPETTWDDLLAGVQTVIHLAALAHERAQALERARDHLPLRRVNVLATERLARCAAETGVKHFVFLSTIGVCGDATFGAPFTEESPPAPRSLYAASKHEAEELLRGVAADTGMTLTVLRPTLVYGPGNGGNFLRLLHAVERGWPLPFAGVRNRRSLTYVANLVSAVIAVLGRRGATETFIVCDETPVSTPELVRRLAAALGRPARLFALPDAALRLAGVLLGKQEAMRRLVGSLEADCSKLGRSLRWRPPVEFARGLHETAVWYAAHRGLNRT